MMQFLHDGLFFPNGVTGSSVAVIVLKIFLACLLPAAIGYLLGSINSAVLLSRILYHDDIRKYGSKNAGMTNMMRTYGKKAAALTLIGDMAKTAIAVLLGAVLLGQNGAYIAGLAAVIGHIWPVYFHFQGGKGVVCVATMILCTEPVAFVILLLVFICIVASTKYISLGSIMGVMLYPLFLNRIYLILHGESLSFIPTVVSFCVMVIVIVKHRSNIRRLLDGKENKFSFKKSVKPAAVSTVSSEISAQTEDGIDEAANPKAAHLSKNKKKRKK